MRATALSAPRLLILVLLAVLAAACAYLAARGLVFHPAAMHYHGGPQGRHLAAMHFHGGPG